MNAPLLDVVLLEIAIASMELAREALKGARWLDTSKTHCKM
jgi:hypothetical protein